MHFRILQMIATALECTKFYFDRGSALDPTEGRAVASQLLVGVLTTLLGVLKIRHIKCSGVPTRHPPYGCI